MSVWQTLFVAGVSAVACALLVRPPPVRPVGLLGAEAGPAPPGDRPRSVEGVARYRAMVSVLVAAGLALFVEGWVGLGVGLLAGVGVWRVVGRLEPPSARRRRERLVASLPTTVDLLTMCLTAGASPGSAVTVVATAVDGPMAEELAAVAARFRMGVDPLRVWTEVAAHPQLGPLGRCLVRAVESGASVAEAMSRLAEDVRRDARAEVEERARGVGVRAAVPLGICLLPAFILVGIVPLVVGSLGMLLSP